MVLLLLFEECCGYGWGWRCLLNSQGHRVSLGVIKMGQTIPRLANQGSLELEMARKRGSQAEGGGLVAGIIIATV